MSRRPVRLLLGDMLERIDRIQRHVVGLDRRAFLQDEKTSDAVVRNLEVIGEAASRLPADFQESHAAIPWRRIAGLRNRVIHAYFDVDLELVWEIVGSELSALKLALRKLSEDVAEHEGSGDP